jgi:hypothetical protein|tara:strand:- start:8681 stop:9058 length:378 start_codon:yes stop_codon:yes gene_type:complete
MSEEYVIVKLLSGEEIMGVTERIDNELITMSNPVLLNRSISPLNGHTWIVCSDYLMFSYGNILDFKQSDVVFYRTDLTEAVIKNYQMYIKNVETIHEVDQDNEKKLREYADHIRQLAQDDKQTVH